MSIQIHCKNEHTPSSTTTKRCVMPKYPTIKPKSFRRVLIANRGEIALRIIRTLRELNIKSVAIYSDADAQSAHVRMADWAVKLVGSDLQNTYLNIPTIIEAARLSKADAIHPGYGFLSENAEFAKEVSSTTNITWIGPSPAAIQALGDKVQARVLLSKHNIPLLPGSTKPLKSFSDIIAYSENIGFPLVIKAAAGGGGKGMRIVWKKQDLSEAYNAAKREAMSFFGNEDIFCEKYLVSPRHIEFQILCDQHGQGVHLFERDCSVQRRCQKLFEEAPSIYLNDTTRKTMGEMAVKIGLLAKYTGAGTIEFICESPSKFYFMEMNTRIQVEHPATEMITGIDLISKTIRIAEGHPLNFAQKDVSINGYAMEARINAEDPQHSFTPSAGDCSTVHFPTGGFVRVDSHISSGYNIPDLYDSLLAKIIVWGNDRSEAIARMKRALQELYIAPVITTKLFHQALLEHPSFIEGCISTTFLEQEDQYFQNYYQTHQDSVHSHEASLLIKTIMAEEHHQRLYATNQCTADNTQWRAQNIRHSILSD